MAARKAVVMRDRLIWGFVNYMRMICFRSEKPCKPARLSVMTAYNEIDGIPCTSNEYLLHQLLRQEWGFDGFVITDCGAINMLAYGHDVAKDGEDAAAIALKAGVDMEMSGEMFGKHLLNAIRESYRDRKRTGRSRSASAQDKVYAGLV